MDWQRWQHLQALFIEALAQPVARREEFVLGACGDDAALRAELQRLLDHDAHDEDPISGVIGQAADRAISDQPGRRGWIDRRLGAWRITAHLADGGMGAVYRAERADGQYQQQAAIKLINPAFLSEHAAVRLTAERQILARLVHPHIARLLDGGTTEEGAPYLVLEYVEGEPIDAYCNARDLDTAARVRLFRQVCAAVDAAHRNLIVHRDLKPANILVDRDGRPKLLDFGIAKLLAGSEATLTVAQQRVLTPTHASPEQVRGDAVTTATDVYSLGVLLYELLAGRLPFAADGNTPNRAAQLAQRILESEPPPPSTAVGLPENARLGAAREAGAALPAERLRRELRGDLDNIVAMAMHKEPARRYASAQALADDLERYLADRPVQARPDRWTYRAAKFLKRRRRVVVGAALVLLAVAAQAAFFVHRIVAERDQAQAARVRAEKIVAFLQDLLRGADRFESAGKEVTVRDILDRGAARIRTELADQPVEQARLMETIANSYLALSMFEPALDLARRSLELRRKALGPTHPETLQSMRTVGVMTFNHGDARSARTILEETLALQLARLGPDAPEVAATLNELGTVQKNLGNPAEALVDLRRAAAILARLAPTHSQYRFLPRVIDQIGNALDATGDRQGAIEAHKKALALFESTGQRDDPVVGAALHNIGLSLNAQGKSEEALPYLHRAIEHTRRTLGEMSSDYEAQTNSLSRTYAVLGRFTEAEKYGQIALETARRLYRGDHPFYAYNLVNMGRLRQLEGRHAEALSLLRQAIAIYRKVYGPYHRFLAAAEVGEGESLTELGRAREAVPLLRGVLERIHKDPERERHVEAIARSVLGRALGLVGRRDEALGLLTGSLRDLRALLGDKHRLTATAAQRLVSFLDSQGRQREADAYRGLLATESTPRK